MALDRSMQRRVWRRVYGKRTPAPPRQALENARRREKQNLQFFRSRAQDPVYSHLENLSSQILAILSNM